jgi:signal transduction histidine kinase
MSSSALEPGLLAVFRLFTGLRLAIAAFGFVAGTTLSLAIHNFPRRPNPPQVWMNLIEVSLLLGYLSWPALQRRMGKFYLPVALIFASIAPIAEQYLAQTQRLELETGAAAQSAGALQVFILLFIPLILIGWQYDFRSVILFALGTAALDGGLAAFLADPNLTRTLPLAGILFTRTASFILVGYMVVRLMSTQREQRRALAEANAQLTHYAAALEQLATSRERNRLARELHDTLAHSLSSVAVQLEGVRTLLDADPAQARTMLDGALAATRSGLTETRRALRDLRASPLEDLGLALAIRSLAESVASRHSLALELDLPEKVNNLSPDVELGVYRVAQEALENVTRHARAQRVKVQLAEEGGRLELTISDDGRGFDVDGTGQEDRFGLQGMREHSQIMGGKLQVESQPGSGTTVRLTVHPPARGGWQGGKP